MSIHLKPIASLAQADSPPGSSLEIASSIYENSLQAGEEIRVFKLSSISSDDIAGHFIVHNLNDLRYSTLSYVWNPDSFHPYECRCDECKEYGPTHGSDHPEGCRCTRCHTHGCRCEHCHPIIRTIQCNGQPIEVQQNCWSALMHIGKQLLKDDLPIWVDAICINQVDEDEKRHQINGLMGKIYSHSSKGFIWLGEGNKHTDDAMEFLSRGGLPSGVVIRDAAAGPTQEYFSSRFSVAWKVAMQDFMWRFRVQSLPHYDGLKEILQQRQSNPWIRRLWTLQEAVLAKRSILVCGQSSADWLSMVHTIDFIECHRQEYGDLLFPSVLGDWKRLTVLWKRHTERSPIPIMQPSSMDPGLDMHEALDFRLQNCRKLLQSARKITRYLQWFVIFVSVACLPPLGLSLFLFSFVDTKFAGLFVTCLVMMIMASWIYFTATPGRRSHASNPLNLDETYHPTPIYEWAESWMIEIATRQVTNPKDKYKGILGIIRKDPPWDNANEPKALSYIYRALFMDLARLTSSLNMLLFVSSAGPKHLRSCVARQSTYLSSLGWRLGDCQMCTKREHCTNCAGQEACSSCLKSRKCGLCLQNKACSVCIALARCGACTRMGKCPTWVLDWRGPDMRWFRALYSDTLADGEPELRRYRGATANSKSTSIEFTPSHMVVKGIIIGDIRFSQRLLPGKGLEVLREHAHLFQNATTWPAQQDQLSRRQISWTLHDLTRFARNSHRKLYKCSGFRKWSEMMARVSEDGTQSICDQLSGHLDRRNPLRKITLAGIRKAHSAMVWFLLKNRLAVIRSSLTEVGFGVAGYDAQQGDNVALISGVSLPLLLRREGDGYKIVSPAFLPQVMDGKLWDSLLDEGRRLETITLV